MVLQQLNKILKTYNIVLQEDERDNFYFMKKSDLKKIAELDNTILESRHNESPTIDEFISIKEQIFFDGRIQIKDGKVKIDVDTAYIPLEFENKKFNRIMNEIGYGVDEIKKTTENYKDYIYLWWD